MPGPFKGERDWGNRVIRFMVIYSQRSPSACLASCPLWATFIQHIYPAHAGLHENPGVKGCSPLELIGLPCKKKRMRRREYILILLLFLHSWAKALWMLYLALVWKLLQTVPVSLDWKIFSYVGGHREHFPPKLVGTGGMVNLREFTFHNLKHTITGQFVRYTRSTVG